MSDLTSATAAKQIQKIQQEEQQTRERIETDQARLKILEVKRLALEPLVTTKPAVKGSSPK